MELSSFKELLLKKAAGDDSLASAISSIEDSSLLEIIIENLEKMARGNVSANKGMPNAFLATFAHNLTEPQMHYMRDAMSHHLSHYKQALKSGNREVADQHLKKVIPLMDLAVRTAVNSKDGKISFHQPADPQAWELNYTTADRHPETGKYVREAKGWGARPSKSVRSARGLPDYRYFEMPPHEGHKNINNHGHRQAYPFEEIQFGPTSDVVAKRAHLYHKDVGPTDKFVPHPFDSHPIHDFFDMEKNEVSSKLGELGKNYEERMKAWNKGPEAQKAISMLERHVNEGVKSGPSGHELNFNKPSPVYEGISTAAQPEHAAAFKAQSQAQPEKAAEPSSDVMANLPESLSRFKVRPKAQAPTETPPASKASTLKDLMANLPPHIRAKYAKG